MLPYGKRSVPDFSEHLNFQDFKCALRLSNHQLLLAVPLVHFCDHRGLSIFCQGPQKLEWHTHPVEIRSTSVSTLKNHLETYFKMALSMSQSYVCVCGKACAQSICICIWIQN